ncbi:hypothetical protein AMS68_000102 [Peltaster fructicola]|uniref:Uncharacterized protein n=1 Tax=Peltaster fructicola TaxID=286661 RepID=A0A6H0XIY4_9PEZI|nr:hypothetical protein AMS68_000102 [Peltaster fructicola]
MSPYISSRASTDSVPQADDLIAVIGMSCKFPGDADTPERLWELCQSGKNAWSEVPPERFNGKAFKDPDYKEPGTINAAGGHFLNADVSKFDASFFNFTYDAASTMDPQIRLQLESVFEATEDAGLPLSRLAGSNTSVFAGCFTKDYNDALARDPDNIPQTILTGNGSSMVSNRTSHFFDLTGPSMTIDTACSTSLTALHLACQSLKTGDSTMSIVTATNLILYTTTFVALSNLGLLGDSGKCYAWDDRAHGYGRGEGVATLIIKPLSRAIADKDNIRAIIRGSALNQDGKTPTITSPSVAAQIALMRDCYRDAGIDPKDTPYVEAHMTGTKVGDPIEAEAISTVFTRDRSPGDPVYVGSIKTNVGHTEATSGIAGVMKAILAVQKGFIPPNAIFDRPNPNIDLELLKVKVPTQLIPWPQGAVRRVSINNFGFGGANAHVIVEAFNRESTAHGQAEATTATTNGHNGINGTNGTNDSTHYQHPLKLQKAAKTEAALLIERQSNGNSNGTANGQNTVDAGSNGVASVPQSIFVLSSKDSGVTDSMRANLAQWLEEKRKAGEQVDLASLSYTLAERRSRLPFASAVIADSVDTLITALNESKKATIAREAPRIGFVFNGQGGQWFAMGRELFAYPEFAQAMQEADAIIKGLGASWSLIDELHKDESISRVQEPAFSQPLCTALQLALVRLLKSWNIEPYAVVSHSSGEAAAAYCVGGLTFAEALGAIYYRGLLTEKYMHANAKKGAMLAAGVSPATALPYLDALEVGKAVVACINSPENVTLSGDEDAIIKLEELLKQDNHFARRLKVEAAYHSHHMLAMADEYLDLLKQVIKPKEGPLDHVYGCPVTGELLTDYAQLGPAHWVQNLTQAVQFSSALQSICLTKPDSSLSPVDFLLEIGPSGTMAGPIRQCLQVPEMRGRTVAYASCLTRNANAINTMQQTVCTLVCKGQAVNLSRTSPGSDKREPHMLTDLPLYPWNHTTSYWKEHRMVRAHRFRADPPVELLGHIVPGTNSFTPTWRSFLKASELPWLRDHVVQSEMVVPGAGYVIMAIEAVKQLLKPIEGTYTGFMLRKVDILRALVVPDTEDGIEVQLTLSPCAESELDSRGWWKFNIYSVTHQDSTWTEHSRGYIALKQKASTSQEVDESSASLFQDKWTEAQTRAWSKSDPEEIFTKLRESGIVHGPLFQNLLDVRVSAPHSSTTFWIQECKVPKTGLPSELVIHPTTLDSIFQAAYPGLASETLKGCMVLPRSIEQVYISASIPQAGGHLLEARAEVKDLGRKGFSSTLTIVDSDGMSDEPVARVTGLFCQAVPMGAVQRQHDDPRTCFKMVWRPDWTYLSSAELKRPITFSADPSDVDMANTLDRAAYHFIHDTLLKLTAEDVQGLSWHQQRFLEWMRLQDRLGAEGKLGRNSQSWANCSQGIKQLLYDEVQTSSVNGRLLCRIGFSLLDIMRNKEAPLELMMRDGLLYETYDKATRAARLSAQTKHLITLFAHKQPHGRILEIGAGTGSATTRVLDALSQETSASGALISRYDFTDISSGFFEQAKTNFAAWSGVMNFQKLDIESDPAAQGFELGSYDLIVACLVLHATQDLEVTMANVRKLMKPGAKLLLIETTRDTLDAQLIFSTLPGWWLGKDRANSPNVNTEEWNRILKATGFSGVDLELRDFEEDHAYSISTMLATASESPRYPEALTIVTSEATSESWAQKFAASLTQATGSSVSVKPLHQLQGEQHCIFLLEMLQPLLNQMDESTFSDVHNALLSSQTALWVANGDYANGVKPDSALHTGLLRTYRVEEVLKRLVSCDLATPEDPWTEANAGILVKLIQKTFDLGKPLDEIDTEYAVRDSQVQIARVYQDARTNDSVKALSKGTEPRLQPWVNNEIPLRIEVGTPGLLDSLMFVPDKSLCEPLPEEYIEIEPTAFGLNFRDVLCALGHIDGNVLGFECSGIVTKTGSRTHQSGLNTGDRVCAVMLGSFGTKVRVHHTWCARVPDTASLEDAASMPLVYATAYQALEVCARLQEGESVLIHAASGGVGQAAIMMAQLKKARIFATVGTDAKKQFIHDTYGIPLDDIFSSRNDSFAAAVMAKTNGAGVDIVLNSLAGNLLKASWECLAYFGRFIEIGRRDIEQDKALSMLPFSRVTTFATVDLNYLIRLRPNLVNEVMGAVMQLWQAGKIRPVAPVTAFPMSEITSAFRLMQSGKHQGKIILTPKPDDQVQVLPLVNHFKFAPDASYLIAGGLGGIGQSLARYLTSNGCKHLIMLSRSAAQHSDADNLISDLKSQGCAVSIRNCDVSDAQALQSTMEDLEKSGVPPVRGVIQAAMVLKDSVFETMTHEKWQATLGPKIDATWNLHNTLPDLDFFVMLSSVVGMMGSPGQSNYAAGSAFQDAFARFRVRQGLHAVSIDLGSIGGVGHAAKTDGVIERLRGLGFEPIEEMQMLRIIEMAMSRVNETVDTSQVITGLSLWDETMEVLWAADHRLWTLKRNNVHGQQDDETAGPKLGSQRDLREAMTKAKTREQAVQCCLDALMNKIKGIFALSDDAVDPSQPLTDFGVDSLVAVEVRNWLSLSLQADVSIFDIMQSASLQVLAEKTVEKSQLVSASILA